MIRKSFRQYLNKERNIHLQRTLLFAKFETKSNSTKDCHNVYSEELETKPFAVLNLNTLLVLAKKIDYRHMTDTNSFHKNSKTSSVDLNKSDAHVINMLQSHKFV